jgi:guanylate kinase
MPVGGETMTGPRQPLGPDDLAILFIGASAVGKSSLAEGMVQAGIAEATPTWTTRKPRQGEVDTSYDHHFVSDEAFDRQAGSFIDQRAFYGARYGVPFLPKPPEGVAALMVLKPVFVPAFIAKYPLTHVIQIEASREVVPERMAARGQSQADIDERMRLHDGEVEASRRLAHASFDNNGPLQETLLQVADHIQAAVRSHPRIAG